MIESALTARILRLMLTLTPGGPLPADVSERLIALADGQNLAISAPALNVLVRWTGSVSGEWRYQQIPLDALLTRLVRENSPLAPAAINAMIQTRSPLASDSDRADQTDLAAACCHALPTGRHPLRLYMVLLLLGDAVDRTIARAGWRLCRAVVGVQSWVGPGIYLTFRSSEFLKLSACSTRCIGPVSGCKSAWANGSLFYRSTSQILRRCGAQIMLLGGLVMSWAFSNFHLLFYKIPLDSPLLVPLYTFSPSVRSQLIVGHPKLRIGLVSAGVLLAILVTWAISLETGDNPLLFLEIGTSVLDALPLVLFLAAVIGLVSQSGIMWRRLSLKLISQPNVLFTKNSDQ
jgi:hypothetical protein